MQIEKAKETLLAVVAEEQEYISSVLKIEEKVQDFKDNFIELAQNSYLMEKINPKETLMMALKATSLGLSINPLYKELYILPFKTKSGVVASLVIGKNGMQELYYQAGFFLSWERVWNINGKAVNEVDMTAEQVASLNVTDGEFVKNNLLLWIVKLEDLSNGEYKLPTQIAKVSMAYALEVTKQIQTPEHTIQTLEHKVLRRARVDFYIPRNRNNTVMEKVDKINDAAETIDIKVAPKKQTADPLKNIDKLMQPKQEEVKELEEEAEEEMLIKKIGDYYKTSDADKKVKIAKVMAQHTKWKTYDKTALLPLLEEIKSV